MEKLFDTHTHYDDAKFDTLSECGRFALLDRLFDTDVGYIVGMGVDLGSSEKQLELASRYKHFYAACGVHPENIPVENDNDQDECMKKLEKLLANPKVVALGEIGLDYYREDNPPRTLQKLWLERQLSLAEKLGLPVVIHDREAHGDCFDAVLAHPRLKGVFHCYSGSEEMAHELVKRGFYISFTGVITYKNTDRLAGVLKSVPEDRLMLETDCPYMAPVPVRGSVNHSGYLRYTAEKAAEIRGVPTCELIKTTTKNAVEFFGIHEREA